MYLAQPCRISSDVACGIESNTSIGLVVLQSGVAIYALQQRVYVVTGLQGHELTV